MKEFMFIWMLLVNFSFYNILNGQSNINLQPKAFLIEKLLPNGESDTIDLIKLINGKDTVSSFTDHNGNEVNYLSFKEKVVLINFWFLACPPCVVELSGLDLIKQKVPSDDFDVLTFTLDSQQVIEEKLLAKRDFNLKMIPNVKMITEKNYPIKMLVNKEGKIIDYKLFGNVGKKSIHLLMERYMPLIKKEIQITKNEIIR